MRSRGSIPLLLNRHIASPLATPNMDRKIWINVVPSARLVDTPSKKRNHSSALDILLNFPINAGPFHSWAVLSSTAPCGGRRPPPLMQWLIILHRDRNALIIPTILAPDLLADMGFCTPLTITCCP